MFRTSLLLCIVCLFSNQVADSKIKAPHDLAEEAEEQLEELKSIVEGDILMAHNDLDSSQTDFGSFSINVAGDGIIALHQEEDLVLEQLATIKDLAISAGKDVTFCTDSREDILNGLTFTHSETMGYCLGGISWTAFLLIEEARYLVDIIMNKVHQIEFELRQCRGDLLCISPIVTRIELNKVELPVDIKTEMQSCQSKIDTLKVSSQECSDTMLADYVADANAILRDITICVNNIIG